MDQSSIQGGCLCGAVRYRIEGPPDWSMLCHCHSCRRQSGAPLVGWITVPAQAFLLLSGTPTRYASSPQVERSFCPQCGTPLTYRHAGQSDSLDVTTCSLDHPEAWPPAYQAWTAEALPWLALDDGLPAHPGAHPSDPETAPPP